MSNTVKLHRVLRASPEVIYRAFLDSDAKCKWLPPYGYVGKVHSNDPRVGGSYRMSFTGFQSQQSHFFGGTYVELIPGKLIRYNDTFEDPNLPGQMNITIELREVFCGTELHVTQENVPSAIPTEMCYLGWQESLEQLARLVEPKV